MNLCIRKRVLKSMRVTSHNTISNEINQKITETSLSTRCKQMSQERSRKRWLQIRKRHFVSNRSQTSMSCVHISQWYRYRQKQSELIALTILFAKFIWYSLFFAPCLFLFSKSKTRINNDTAFSNYSHSVFHCFSLFCWARLTRILKTSLSETFTFVTLKILRLRMLSCFRSYYSTQSLALRVCSQNVCEKCSLMTDHWLYVVQWF